MKRAAIVVFENLLAYQFFKVIYRFLHWSDRILISVFSGTKPHIFGVLRETADWPALLILSEASRPGNWTPQFRLDLVSVRDERRSVINDYFITSSTGSPSSKYDHRHYCVTLEIQRKYKDLYRKKDLSFL